MKWILIAFLVAPLTFFSQEDTVYYSADRPLTWADFREKPDLSNNNNHAAMISSGFGVESHMKVIGDKGTVKFEVETYMIPEKSWVKPGKDNDNVLAHEQLHFDITYYQTVLLEQKLNELEYHPHLKQEIRDIVKQTYRNLDKMQSAYDRETNGGLDLKAQRKWQKKMEKLIAEATR